MAASDEQLKLLAQYKHELRMTDAECADKFGVSSRTIQRWLQSTDFGQVVTEFKRTRKDDVQARLAGLADDVVSNMVLLMSSSSELVKFQATKELGIWLGLDKLKEDTEVDERDETVELLRQIAGKPPVQIYLPPPMPGGSLPALTDQRIIDVEAVEAPSADKVLAQWLHTQPASNEKEVLEIEEI